jgi:hypothetical protein
MASRDQVCQGVKAGHAGQAYQLLDLVARHQVLSTEWVKVELEKSPKFLCVSGVNDEEVYCRHRRVERNWSRRR